MEPPAWLVDKAGMLVVQQFALLLGLRWWMFGLVRVPELVALLVILLLVIGPGKLPSLGRGLGEMIRGFRQEAGADKDVQGTDQAETASKS
ncbi:MAG: twin-arginine translocase TatA/TatE family subunit [Chloroflexi bacterium]|nr:twin-arginine translocase TatA/TatE family subunit [Chloroflexota bacterium]